MTRLPDLGDPWDPANPVGHQAVLAADERGEMLAEGEKLLEGYRLNEHFVPKALGGRFGQADELAAVMRQVFRRDATLGIGYGVTNFIAAIPVWTAGDAEQRRTLAELLLDGGRAAAAFTELAHGADFSRTEVSAEPSAGGYRITGTKHLINNIGRAGLVTLFARTDDRPGSRGHSLLQVDLRSAGSRDYRVLPRFAISGMRGTPLAGIEFTGLSTPRSTVVGEPGEAMETVLRAFQVTRCVLPGMVLGIVDSQLRLALRFALGRGLYGRRVADLPHARTLLTGAFLDLLIADCLALTGARALHVLPTEGSVLSAAVKYLVPKLSQSVSYDLSTLLGAGFYLRDGEFAMFGKHARDLPVAVLAHASPAVCQATIIPQLPRLARTSWLSAAPPPDELFQLGSPLSALEPGALEINARGRDSLSATLAAAREDGESCPEISGFVEELAELRGLCLDLPPRHRSVIAGRPAFDLAHRYSLVLAAAACTGVWRAHRGQGFLGDPRWLVAALRRLRLRRVGSSGPLWTRDDQEPPAVVHAELLRRYAENRGFDLAGPRLSAPHD